MASRHVYAHTAYWDLAQMNDTTQRKGVSEDDELTMNMNDETPTHDYYDKKTIIYRFKLVVKSIANSSYDGS